LRVTTTPFFSRLHTLKTAVLVVHSLSSDTFTSSPFNPSRP
jgi:hypothetical protein